MILTHKQKGFTLIELLVVISIMGILFAMAIPAFRTYERNAAVRVGAKELRSFFWSVQALSLSPESTDVTRYYATVGSGISGALARKVLTDSSTPTVDEGKIVPWKPKSPVVVEAIFASKPGSATTTVPSVSIDFNTGNADGGKMKISAGGTQYTSLVIRLKSPASPLQYEVVLDSGNNTVDMRKMP
ncbi:MAG: prepilin-type N-terminal cleavage/methylation domain-containing protein [Patescibacteria group bacterium]